jgi:hypothetical protein
MKAYYQDYLYPALIYLCMANLMMLSMAQITEHNILAWFLTNELERMWKEETMA